MSKQRAIRLVDWLLIYIGLPVLVLFVALHVRTAAAANQPVLAVDIAKVAESAAVVAAQQPGVKTRVTARLDNRVAMPACDSELQGRVHSDTNTAMSIAVACAGPQPWTLYVPVRLQREAEVVVLASSLPAGTVLQASHLSKQTKDIGQLSYGYLQDSQAIIGNRLRRPLQAGWALSGNDIESPRIVRRGDTVTLVARTGSIEVRAQGQALADAGANEPVRVKNLSSRRIIDGRVSGDGTVAVGF
ncbi:MAG: flagellar basal body P-ring formation chaperone FlgA [Salinisphaeraceae bacterium]|nr:flagellar basal body P-ring formation chaperone FlgA [Salinisphaeraceae bacterium]